MFYVLIKKDSSLFYVNRLDVDDLVWTSDIREARKYEECQEAHYLASLFDCQVLAIRFLEPNEEINLASGWEQYA